jgi:hypothetical protein
MIGNQGMASVIDTMKMEIMNQCSCGRDKAIYFCKNKSCPKNQSQPYYCFVCQQDEEDSHDHKALSIVKEVREHQAVWDSMKDELASLLAAAMKV